MPCIEKTVVRQESDVPKYLTSVFTQGEPQVLCILTKDAAVVCSRDYKEYDDKKEGGAL